MIFIGYYWISKIKPLSRTLTQIVTQTEFRPAHLFKSHVWPVSRLLNVLKCSFQWTQRALRVVNADPAARLTAKLTLDPSNEMKEAWNGAWLFAEFAKFIIFPKMFIKIKFKCITSWISHQCPNGSTMKLLKVQFEIRHSQLA